MLKFIARFRKDESGATAIEYGLIAALLAIGVIAGATALGKNIDTAFGNLGDSLVTNSNKTEYPN